MRTNTTEVTELTLSGLSSPAGIRHGVFALLLLCYCLIWLLNVGVVAAVAADRSLHEPMYILLCNLCLNGLYGTAAFYPKFLGDLLSSSYVISFSGCLLQDFVLHSSTCAHYSLLLLMALDRYVAVCRPLVYHAVMSARRLSALLAFAWLTPGCLLAVSMLSATTLRLCSSHIPKLYCAKFLLLQAACAPSKAHLLMTVINYSFYLAHVAVVLWSYLHLVRTCRASRLGRRKLVQTCLPHLLCLLALALCFLFDRLYMRFGTDRLPQSVAVFIELQFLIIPPIMNPLIYGLNLSKIRTRVMRCCVVEVRGSRGGRVRPARCARRNKSDSFA